MLCLVFYLSILPIPVSLGPLRQPLSSPTTSTLLQTRYPLVFYSSALIKYPTITPAWPSPGAFFPQYVALPRSINDTWDRPYITKTSKTRREGPHDASVTLRALFVCPCTFDHSLWAPFQSGLTENLPQRRPLHLLRLVANYPHIQMAQHTRCTCGCARLVPRKTQLRHLAGKTTTSTRIQRPPAFQNLFDTLRRTIRLPSRPRQPQPPLPHPSPDSSPPSPLAHGNTSPSPPSPQPEPHSLENHDAMSIDLPQNLPGMLPASTASSSGQGSGGRNRLNDSDDEESELDEESDEEAWELSEEDSGAEDGLGGGEPWVRGLTAAEVLEEEFDVECAERGMHTSLTVLMIV